MKRVLLIVNPISGRGHALRAAEKAVRVLTEAGVEVEVLETREAGDARRFAAERAADADAIVPVGGDGTLAEVISGLASGGTVGLIPVGTANVVARDLGIPRRPRKAARGILSGSPRSIDVGQVGDRRFLAMVGVGFDAEVVKLVSAGREGAISMASYLLPTTRALRQAASVPLRLTVDGVPMEPEVYGVIVSNTRCYGGLMSVTPRADPADGILDFQALIAGGTRATLRWALAAILRRPLPPEIAHYGRGRRFRIEAAEPVPVQVDGDSAGTTPVDIELMQQRVRIIAPDPRPSPGENP